MTPTPKPLRQWIWRAFVKSALIPLILVECVLIAVYLLTNTYIRDAQLKHLQENAILDLGAAVLREGKVIDSRLQAIEEQALLFRDVVLQALGNTDFVPDAVERRRHRVSPEGVFYSHSDDGRAASFYANSTPLARQDHRKALRLSQIDPFMRSLRQANPLVSASYFNSWDSYNRIYPFFLTPEQYPHDMVIPDYNFYYLADRQHNPARKAVWTDVYLDPAGLGWMMSAVAPVYRQDFLEGVVGLDITVGKMLTEIAELEVPWQGYAMLISRESSIMVLPDAGEKDFGLEELTDYSYEEAVRREILKPEDFNLMRQNGMRPLLKAIRDGNGNVSEVDLGGRKQLVAWSEIPQTGWRLLMVVDEAQVFRQTNRLASHFQNLGYLLIAGLLFFYLVFFAWMWLRSRRLSDELSGPIAGIVGMLHSLGRGVFAPQAPETAITELQDISGSVLQTGQRLQQSEQERERAGRYLELVLESTTENLWELDVYKGTVLFSERFVLRFGLPATRMTLEQVDGFVLEEDRERVRELRDNFIMLKQGQYEAEYRMRDVSGRVVWLLSRGNALECDPHGRIMKVVGTHLDITRLKTVQDELRLASQEAQAASEAKSRFLSSMSHELRTPLNAIHGFAQLIELDADERERRMEYAQEIIRASRHLTALVDDMLDLSSIEQRQQVLQMDIVEPAALLQACAEWIQPQVRAAGLELVFDYAEGPDVCVRGDVRRLRQIMLNLLSNAIKYNLPAGQVRLGVTCEAGRVRMWVEDSGPGLTAQQLARLFQPFQRLGRENSSVPGTGIGLVLCRELAALMDGEIGVSSHPGQGSRFWLELPAWTGA